MPVAGYVSDYCKTNPGKNQHEMAQFLYSYGMAYEVHWREGDIPNSIREVSSTNIIIGQKG